MSTQGGTVARRWNAALCLVCLCGFLLRLVPLGRYVTPDEPAWVYRSIRFADALAARDWAAIPTTGHPGVTTMWLGTIGVAVQRLLSPAESAIHLDWVRRLAWLAPENGEAFRHLAFFLSWGRIIVALTTTAGLAVFYFLIGRLHGQRVALALTTLLACDPFLIGHSGLLHTDALLTTFISLALGAGLNGLSEPRRLLWWPLAGFFTGLALLTKLSAVILLPFIPVLILVAQRAHLKALLVSTILFPACVILTALLFCPAFWADLPAAIERLFASAEKQVETVQHPVFFAGRMTYDPGPAFYPVVFVFRVSPVVLAGLLIGLTGVRRMPAGQRRTFALLLAFALAFGTMIGLGAKKYDRYLLPVFPPLMLAAVLGWMHLDRRLLLLLPIIQLIILLPCVPYPLAAFNPLVGGEGYAAHVLEVGWGEEMGMAARWLNRLPQAESLSVATPSIPPFASLFKGRTLPLSRATQADYVVQSPWPYTTVTPTGSTGAAALRPYMLVFEFARPVAVLTNTAPLELAAYLNEQSRPGELILLDAETPLLRHYGGPAAIVSFADAPDPSAILARLSALNVPAHVLWLVADPAAAPLTNLHLRQVLEAIAEAEQTTTIAGSAVTRYRLRWPSVTSGMGFDHAYPKYRFGSSPDQELRLVDALLPNTPVNAPFPVHLRWQLVSPTRSGFYASLYLADADGHLWAEVGQQVLNQAGFPTTAWPLPGGSDWADIVLVLPLPERIPPATYTVQLTLSDERGAQPGGWDASGHFRGVRVPLGEVEVVPPPEPVGPGECREGKVLSAGPFQVCHHRVVTTPQGTCHLEFIWSAIARPEADYLVRLRVLDAAGAIVLERIEPLSSYPTSRWRVQDSFEAHYDLRLDPGLPAADYLLTYNVLGPDGIPLWELDEHLTLLTVSPHAREFELPEDIAHPLNLTLGDVVHLRGFDAPDYPTLTVTRGDVLTLTLYWQADGPTDLDYSVFVHLVGPDGQNHGQADYLAGGGVGTAGWVPGQVTVDRVHLSVAADAPAGKHRLAVGMYDALTGVRLHITDPGGLEISEERAFLPLEIVVKAD